MAKHSKPVDRLKILRAVRTPLGFFVLVLLVIETTFVAIGTKVGQDKTLMLFVINIGAIILLTLIVALLAYLNVLDGDKRRSIPDYSLFIEPPDDLPGLDINRIIWDEPKCLMKINEKMVTFAPTSPSDSKGAALEIRIASSDFPADEHTPIELTLTDQFGNRWDVRRFRLWQRNLRLRTRSDKDKIIQDYRD